QEVCEGKGKGEARGRGREEEARIHRKLRYES
ncbi:hypothetical protein A2U01_0101116, partial [Trifolium medium]|nr:hypothetical protein [Trifolium medium]